MKKKTGTIILFAAALLLSIGLLAACGKESSKDGSSETSAESSAGSQSAVSSEASSKSSGNSGSSEAVTSGSESEKKQTASESGKEQASGSSQETQTVESIIKENNTLTKAFSYKGKDYGFRTDIKTYLIVGVDRHGEIEISDSHIGTGQCDAIYLVVIDSKNNKSSVLQLDRDAMVDMTITDATGTVFGYANQQLAYAHAYGDGAEKSCEHTEDTISAYLKGIPIDGYIAMQFEALPILNDAVGCVTVYVEDDMSSIDPALTKGSTVTLKGDTALNYVRTRKGVTESLNTSRMKRQRTYLQGFRESFREAFKANSKIVETMYSDAEAYICTDLSTGTLTNIAAKLMDYSFAGFSTLEGSYEIVENENGTSLMEFTTDDDSVYENVIKLFCAELD